jgi:amidase
MAISESVLFWSTVQQAHAIKTGEFTSRALLELMIQQIESINPKLNAVVSFDLANARAAADAADTRVKSGQPLEALHGIPITIKDALQTKGLRSTGGAIELHNNIPETNAPVVQAMVDAGAIVFGKTNLPRWSGDIQAFNEIFGTTSNPWDLSRVPGGSSGGAAAAVATGMSSFEIGTDIGGSIRFPAAFCGIYGHKPSFGIVPSTGYIDHMDGGINEADVNVVGPLARSAEDLELLLNLMLRKQGPLVASLSPPKDIASLKVAAWLDDPFCPVDSKVALVLKDAVAKLEASGVSVDHTARPDIDPAEAFTIGSYLVTSAMLQSMSTQALETLNEDYVSPSKNAHKAWLDNHAKREAIRLKWAEFFNEYDAIIMPISFVPPFPHNQEGNFGSRTLICNGDERAYADLVRWTILTGMAYLPATTPPIGLDEDGLPISFQIVGPYGGDYTTIALAKHIAEHGVGYQRPPLS